MADAATISVLLTARDEASAQLKKVEGNMGKLSESFSKHRRGIGMAAAGIGAAITGIAVLSMKSSLDQEIGIRTLDQALKRVGTSYDSNKEKIEAVISAQQNKTNFGDEEQRKALEKLITIGGTYDGSLTALKVTMDLAAGANMGLAGASLLVAKAIAGETSSLSRYGIVIEKGASQTEIMAALTRQFGGSAEAAADPIIQLKNRLGDLMQVFGDMLLPIMTEVLPKIELFIRRVIEWAEEHPTLTKVIGLSAAALGGVLLIVGPLLLLLPTLASAFGLLSVAMGPITLITLGIAAAIAAAIIIYKKWDDWNREVKVGVVLLGAAIAFALGPIGLAVAAVAAAILVWKNWDKVVGFMRKAIADFAVTTIIWIRKLMEGVKTLAGWVPGLGKVEEALESGINKLKDMEKSIDHWSVSSGDRVRDQALAWGALEDEQMLSAQAMIENNERLGNKTKEVRATVEEELKEMGNAWGTLEDEVGISQGGIIRSLEDLEGEQETFAALQRLSLLSTISLKEKERLAFITGNDAIIASSQQRREDLAQIAKDEAQIVQDRVEAEADALARQIGSWDRFKQNLDPVMMAINEQNLGFAEIVQLMAKDTGVSLKQMGKDVEEAGITWNDTWGLVNSNLAKNLEAILGNVKTTGDGIKKSVLSWQEALASGVDSSKLTPEHFKEIGSSRASLVAAGRAMDRQKIWRDVKAWEAEANRAASFGAGIPDWITKQLEGTIALWEAMRPISQGGPADFSSFLAFKNMGHGGIVTQPTLAMIGESGPEAVIPLGRGGGMGTVNNFHFHGSVYGVEDLKEAVVEAVRDHAISGGFAGVFAEA